MTGTAVTEADELFDIYKLEVVEIPTNVQVARLDEDDEVYRTQTEKYAAILAEIERANSRLQPVLVGTASIEKSEVLAEYLKKPRLQADRFRQRKRDGEALRGGPRRQAGKAVRGAERALPRAGSLHRRRSRRARRDHDRDQHGRPRHRHQARRFAGNADHARDRRDYRRGREGRQDRAHQGRRRAFPRDRAEGRRDGRDRAGQGLEAGEDRDQAGRALHHRLGAPRIPPYRQPAARPLRPPGRSRALEILPVAGRRSDADLRLRPARYHADAARPRGRRGHHPSLDQQGAGEGAAEGRGPQLRHPQEPVEVRQRPERPAQGDLRPAHRPDEGRKRRRDGCRHAPRLRRGCRHQARARTRLCRAVGRRRPQGRTEARARRRSAGRRMGQGRGHRRRGTAVAHRGPRRRAHGGQGRAMGPRRDALRREDHPAADAGSSVARASDHARSSAPGDRPARLRPARSAAGVQVGSVQPVRGDDRASARGGDGAVDARRNRAAGRTAAGIACHGSAQVRSEHRRGRTGLRRRLAGARGRRRPRSQESGELGQGRPQRGLPLRLRQEVQALPRPLCLTSRCVFVALVV